jgi:2,4-diaminopentanoate dehydrogenase
MTSRLRVAHFGTGHTGTQVLRQILQRPDLELVGHLLNTPEKVADRVPSGCRRGD